MVMEKMAQFHSVHIGHKNICQHDIHRVLLYKFRRLLAVLADSGQLAVQPRPVNIFLYGISYKNFIIY